MIDFSELKLKILYYCKTGKKLMDISRHFDKSYWYIAHMMGELRYDNLIITVKKGNIVTFTTPIEVVIEVENEMRKRFEERYNLIVVPTA